MRSSGMIEREIIMELGVATEDRRRPPGKPTDGTPLRRAQLAAAGMMHLGLSPFSGRQEWDRCQLSPTLRDLFALSPLDGWLLNHVRQSITAHIDRPTKDDVLRIVSSFELDDRADLWLKVMRRANRQGYRRWPGDTHAAALLGAAQREEVEQEGGLRNAQDVWEDWKRLKRTWERNLERYAISSDDAEVRSDAKRTEKPAWRRVAGLPVPFQDFPSRALEDGIPESSSRRCAECADLLPVNPATVVRRPGFALDGTPTLAFYAFACTEHRQVVTERERSERMRPPSSA